MIEPWRRADAAGLCAAEVLQIVNSVLSRRFIGADAPNAELERRSSTVEKPITEETGISSESLGGVAAHPLAALPLRRAGLVRSAAARYRTPCKPCARGTPYAAIDGADPVK